MHTKAKEDNEGEEEKEEEEEEEKKEEKKVGKKVEKKKEKKEEKKDAKEEEDIAEPALTIKISGTHGDTGIHPVVTSEETGRLHPGKV